MMQTQPDQNERKVWIGLLARAQPDRLRDLLTDLPQHVTLRGPEVGAVMVRGRVGATGQPFSPGEMTVTRCAVRLAGGAVGHAHAQGRDKGHVRSAAVVDALMQIDAVAIRAQVLTPLTTAEAEARTLRAAKAAATKVEFFTLVRGEDT